MRLRFDVWHVSTRRKAYSFQTPHRSNPQGPLADNERCPVKRCVVATPQETCGPLDKNHFDFSYGVGLMLTACRDIRGSGQHTASAELPTANRLFVLSKTTQPISLESSSKSGIYIRQNTRWLTSRNFRPTQMTRHLRQEARPAQHQTKMLFQASNMDSASRNRTCQRTGTNAAPPESYVPAG